MKKVCFYLTIIFGMIFIACNSSKIGQKNDKKQLNLKSCLLNEKPYEYVTIDVPNKYLLKKEINHGFCEYRFKYDNGIVLYVSTDIYNGSSLNYENLLQNGINSYSQNRSDKFKDTIKNSGKDIKSKYWLEYILGDVVVGYINVPENRKADFDKSITTLIREGGKGTE